MKLNLAVTVAVLAAAITSATAHAAQFSLLAQAEGNQTVKLTFTNTQDTSFYVFRDRQLVGIINGTPTFSVNETGQPVGQHTYQAFSQCTHQFGLVCADQSNQVTVTVT